MDREVGLLLITLDSCRFDTAERAELPFLSALCTPTRSWSHGSFTLPAHQALFSGYLPRPVDGSSRSGDLLPPLPRPATGVTPAPDLDAPPNSIAFLRSQGYETLGFGGVRWFLHNALRTGFSQFTYWGPEYSGADIDGMSAWKFGDYALDHPAEIAEQVKAAHQRGGGWFAFINAAETHAPYGMSDEAIRRMQAPYRAIRNGRGRVGPDEQVLMKELHAAQVQALERVDTKLEALFDLLPRPTQFVVCGDHGESFGENDVWGHVIGSPAVMEVPVWTGEIT